MQHRSHSYPGFSQVTLVLNTIIKICRKHSDLCNRFFMLDGLLIGGVHGGNFWNFSEVRVLHGILSIPQNSSKFSRISTINFHGVTLYYMEFRAFFIRNFVRQGNIFRNFDSFHFSALPLHPLPWYLSLLYSFKITRKHTDVLHINVEEKTINSRNLYSSVHNTCRHSFGVILIFPSFILLCLLLCATFFRPETQKDTPSLYTLYIN